MAPDYQLFYAFVRSNWTAEHSMETNYADMTDLVMRYHSVVTTLCPLCPRRTPDFPLASGTARSCTVPQAPIALLGCHSP